MKNSWKFNINVYAKAYLFSEITDKLRAIIRYDEIRGIVFLIKFSESDAVYTDSIDFLYKHKCGIFKEAIHNNHHINANLSISIDK